MGFCGGAHARAVAGPEPYPGTPRWVKIAGIVALAVLVVALAAAFLLGGEHGPARHAAP